MDLYKITYDWIQQSDSQWYGECVNSNNVILFNDKTSTFNVMNQNGLYIGITGFLLCDARNFILTIITYNVVNDNNLDVVTISHYDNKRIISIFNKINQTTRYIIDDIKENCIEQFNQYLNKEIPTIENNKYLDIAIDNNGKINKVDVISNNINNVLKGILKYRIDISNGYNIELINNFATCILATNIPVSNYDNTRITNFQQNLNSVFGNRRIDNNIETYFNRLSNSNLNSEEKLLKLKSDFDFNNVDKDFATILFECNRHVSVIVIDLVNKNKKIQDVLYLFDTSGLHSQYLNIYFGNLIKQENIVLKSSIQFVNNCSWLSCSFVKKCSNLINFPRENDKLILTNDILADTIHITSKLMQEKLDNFITLESKSNITLNNSISKTTSIDIWGLCYELRGNLYNNISNDDKIIKLSKDGYDENTFEPKKIEYEITETQYLVDLQKNNSLEKGISYGNGYDKIDNKVFNNLIFTNNESNTLKSEQEIISNTKKYINSLENKDDIKNLIHGFKEIIDSNESLTNDEQQIIVISCFKAMHESKNVNIKQHMSEYIKSDTDTKNKLIEVLNSSDNNRNIVKYIMKNIQENKQTSQIYK